jgi:hypothetical protein
MQGFSQLCLDQAQHARQLGWGSCESAAIRDDSFCSRFGFCYASNALTAGDEEGGPLMANTFHLYDGVGDLVRQFSPAPHLVTFLDGR